MKKKQSYKLNPARILLYTCFLFSIVLIFIIKFSPEKKGLTIKDVAKHNNINDCWMVINNKIYNITKFIPDHPGGDVIAIDCRKDGTHDFENRPMGDMNMPHSDEARDMLKKYYLEDLKKSN